MNTPLKRTGELVVLVALVVAVAAFATVPDAQATPGQGNHMRFAPNPQTPRSGTLYLYVNSQLFRTMTAGSGTGPNFNNPCAANEGRLPNGWYNTNYEHHVDNKNNAIKGRVWGLSTKDCGNGTVRWGLFVHTEETAANGQDCTPTYDDPYCWERSQDYESAGCVKVSYPNNGFPNSIGALNSWWHNQVGGGHGVSYYSILYVLPLGGP